MPLPGMAAAPDDCERDHVKVSLISEQSGVVPGTTSWIGLRLTHEPHWHTYWINPGDSGLPTKLTWHLPEGLASPTFHGRRRRASHSAISRISPTPATSFCRFKSLCQAMRPKEARCMWPSTRNGWFAARNGLREARHSVSTFPSARSPPITRRPKTLRCRASGHAACSTLERQRAREWQRDGCRFARLAFRERSDHRRVSRSTEKS